MRGILGLFFGRSREIGRLDEALRAAGLHPRLVPDSVKFATVKLLREAGREILSHPDAAADAGTLLAYCMLGGDGYADAGGGDDVRSLEVRLQAAIEAGDSLDARLVLLTLHAGVIQPEVVSRFGLEAI